MNVYFIDRDGNKIYMEDISSHIGLAYGILEHDERLKEEFQKSGKKDPTDFLIYDKGYIKLTNQLYYRSCVYLSSRISEKQQRLLRFFAEEGYNLDDLQIRQLEDNVR